MSQTKTHFSKYGIQSSDPSRIRPFKRVLKLKHMNKVGWVKLWFQSLFFLSVAKSFTFKC